VCSVIGGNIARSVDARRGNTFVGSQNLGVDGVLTLVKRDAHGQQAGLSLHENGSLWKREDARLLGDHFLQVFEEEGNNSTEASERL
jgi:hypothetical protein